MRIDTRDISNVYADMLSNKKIDTKNLDAALKKDDRPYILVPLGVDKDGKAKTTAKPNPNIKKRHDNALLCLKYIDQLGLSPLARARAGVKGANAKEEESIFLKFMGRSDDD